MHQACRILILFIVLFLVLIDLGRTAKTAKTSTARTTVKERVTGPLLENQIATTTVAIIPLTTIAKRQGIYPPRGNQITPGDTTTTSTTTTEKQMFDSSDRNQSIPSDVTIPSTSINSPLSLSQTTATKVTASSTTVGGLPDSSLTPTTTESVPDVTTVDCIPGEVQSLTATPQLNSIMVTWEAPVDNNCKVGYTVVLNEQVNITGTEYTFSGLEACTSYTASVAVFSDTAYGKSSTVSATTTTPTLNTPPTLASPVSIDKTSATITLSLQEYKANMCNIFRIIVNCTLEGSESIEISKMQDHTDSSTRTATVIMENLLPYTNYICYAYVENPAGISNASDAIEFRTSEDLPSAPRALNVVEDEEGLLITWKEPEEIPGVLGSYSITITPNESLHDIPLDCEYDATTFKTETSGLEYRYRNILANFLYRISVAASTGAGIGPETAKTVETNPQAPEIPRDVSRELVNDKSDTMLVITWKLPCKINGNLKHFEWILIGQHLENGNEVENNGTVQPTGDHSYEISINVLQYHNYTFRLAAYVQKGTDAIKGEDYVDTFVTGDGIPSAPQELVVMQDEEGLLIIWKEPEEVFGILGNYSVGITPIGPQHNISEDCDLPTEQWNDLTLALEYRYTNIFANYDYNISVAASTRAGFGPEKSTTIVTDPEVPEKPRNVNLTVLETIDSTSGIKAFIDWSEPCKINGELRYFEWALEGRHLDNGKMDNRTEIVNPSEDHNYRETITNLLPYHEYTLRLAAYVANDSNEIKGDEYVGTFKTVDGYPDAPTQLRVENVTSTGFNILWDEPFEKNGEILSYKIIIDTAGPNHVIPTGCPFPEYEASNNYSTTSKDFSLQFANGKPNFNYTITLVAETSAGFGKENVIDVVTKSAAPQSIENLKMNITDNKSESYASYVEISFDKPCTLNAMFSHYSVSIVGKRTGFDDHAHLFSIDDFGNTSFPFNLQPEYNYAGSISVVTLFHNSTLAIPDFLSPAGVPPPTTSVPGIYRFTPNTASIILNNEMFDRTFGDIMYYAIIINVGMDNAEELGGGFQFLSAASVWPNSSYYGHEEYQATPAFWNPFKKRTTNYTYTIGNENCSANLTSYCNGPLKPQTNYGVRVRGFTSSGYRDTEVAYFTTPAEETYLALILGLIFGILAAIILLIFIFILWRRKRKEKEDNPSEDAVIEISKPPPISKNRFIDHCLMFEEDRSLLKAEYSHLDRLSATEKPSINVAMSDNNKRKNRYINIMPYDETRVKLSMDSNENYEDYINASYIRGYSKNPEYIATQGPMESTLEDFWRMIIQENVGVIVMVAQFVEQSKQKCFKYFPEKEEIMSVGRDINVKCTNEINLNDYINRTLLVERGSEQMTIKHLQYMLWPDFGCPTDTTSMLEFREVVRKHIEMSKSKAVIHCSAGVGRTGTLIAIDILLQKIDNSDDDINVFGTVLDLRKQRTHMVQTEKQYEYIHKCLREYLTKPKKTNEGYNNLGPIYENVNIINGYTNIIRNSGPHTSTENLIRLKEL